MGLGKLEEIKIQDTMLVTIHKDNQSFVKKQAAEGGCKNPSEWVNAVIRRLKALEEAKK